jgi:hypothetical protein
MAAKKKQNEPAAPAANLGELMREAVQARQTGTAMYSSKLIMAPLISHSAGVLVEYNEATPAPDGRIPFRATEQGMQVYASGVFGAPAPAPFGGAPAPFQAPTQQPTQQLPSGTTYTFKKGIPIPPSKRPGRGPNTYGFEQMEIGDAFDIPATAENPNPGKRVASTVSSATKRLAPKQFVVRAIEENGVKLARVWRSA